MKLDLSPLENFQLEKVSASIILDLRRPKASGQFPVKYRVTFNRVQHYYPCMDLSEEEFSRLHGSVRDLLLVKTKKLILDGFKRITDAIEEVIQKEIFTLNGLARRINGGTSDSILDTFEVKITRLEEEGRIGSAVWYRCAKNSIEKYWKKDLKFSELTTDWLKEYQKHLEKEKKKETTISINLRALRAIVNDGMRKGIISQSQYPFR